MSNPPPKANRNQPDITDAQVLDWMAARTRILQEAPISAGLQALLDAQARLSLSMVNEIRDLRAGLRLTTALLHLLRQKLDLAPQIESELEAILGTIEHHLSPAAEICHVVEGFPLYINRRDPGYVTRHLRGQRGYQPDETLFIKQHLKPGQVFVDVGAHIGYFTVLAAHLVGKFGRVIAIEPDPENAALLAINASALPDPAVVELVQAGLGSENRTGYIYRNPVHFGDHRVYEPDAPEDPVIRREAMAIPIRTADDVLAREKRIDVVKIDTQGFEAAVLRGMKRTIERHRPVLLFEYWPRALASSGHTALEPLQLLHDLGYGIYRLGMYLERYVPDPGQVDALSRSDFQTDLVGIYQPDEMAVDWLDARTLLPRTPATHLSLTFDQPMNGEGWLPPRASTGHQIRRWTSQPVATLNVLLDDQFDYRITFAVLRAITPQVLDSLALTVNETAIALDRKPGDEGTLFHGIIPRSAVRQDADNTRLAFQVSHTVSPAEVYGRGSERQHGVAFMWLSIDPLEADRP